MCYIEFLLQFLDHIADDLLDVPHLRGTLTADDLLWPFFHTDRSLLKVLLKTSPQAVRYASRLG